MGTFEEIVSCIEENKSFVVEAGAGSGKTYSLIQTLRYLIDNKSDKLDKKRQKIICITYTNVAKNEIIERIEFNELIGVYTIHEFLWNSIKQFQKQLKVELCKLNESRLGKDIEEGKASKYVGNLSERIDHIDSVFYNDSSFRDFEKGELHHDDVIELAKMIFENYPLISTIMAQKYPYVFIDEYQDSAEDTIELLIDYFLNQNKEKVALGFYGDSHQRIYDDGVGSLEKYYSNLKLIKKEENYRSSKSVVELLNNFRENIQQIPQKENMGEAKFLYWADHPVKSRSQGKIEFENSLKPDKNDLYEQVLSKLKKDGWEFEGEDSEDKILLLANRRIAERADFSDLYTVFSKRNGLAIKDNLLDRNHILIKILCGYIDKKTSQERKVGLEHLIEYWEQNNHNEVIRFIKKNGAFLRDFNHQKKKRISDILNDLANDRKNKTVGEVLKIVLDNGILFSKSFNEFVSKINQDLGKLEEDKKKRIEKDKKLYDSFIELSYSDILNFWKHIQNETVFSTKHGTKGDEFRNVLSVIDDTEWKSQYNFDNFFNRSEDKPKRELRTRNLFYVECSRAKEKLFVLMLSKISDDSLIIIRKWFGTENVIDVEEYLNRD